MERLRGANGVELAVRRHRPSGATPDLTVLLLHGWPGTNADWDDVIELILATGLASADILAPDLRGFGDSDRPAGTDFARFGPAAHVADLTSMLDEVHAANVLVAGYDLGATLAQRLAQADDRVRGLVLGCPPYPGIAERRFEPAIQAELWYQQLHLQPWAADLIAHDRETLETYLRHFYTHWWGEGPTDETHFQRVVDAYARPGAFDASIGWYRAGASARRAPATAATAAPPVTQPTAVLWGEQDPVIPIRLADRLEEFFTQSVFTPLPTAGHFIPLEASKETADALVSVAALARL